MESRVAAIVLAGGRGDRLGGAANKIYQRVGGNPVLEYSLSTFAISKRIKQIVVVARQEDHSKLSPIVVGIKHQEPVIVVGGGNTRHRSETAGLEALATLIEAGTFDLVAIHDGARPFMTLELLEACIELAAKVGGAFPGLPTSPGEHRVDRHRVNPLDKKTLIRVQTPQIFQAEPLLSAYRAAAAAGFEGVDTAETVERFSNLRLGVVPGDERNLKITHPADLITAAEYASDWDGGHWLTNPET